MKKIIILILCVLCTIFYSSCTDFDDIEEVCFEENCNSPRINGSIYCAAHDYEFQKSYNSRRCAAYTKKGTRCKRYAEKGSIYCWQHK